MSFILLCVKSIAPVSIDPRGIGAYYQHVLAPESLYPLSALYQVYRAMPSQGASVPVSVDNFRDIFFKGIVRRLPFVARVYLLRSFSMTMTLHALIDSCGDWDPERASQLEASVLLIPELRTSSSRVADGFREQNPQICLRACVRDLAPSHPSVVIWGSKCTWDEYCQNGV